MLTWFLLAFMAHTAASTVRAQHSTYDHTYVLLAGIVGGTHGMTRLATTLERDGHRVVVLDPYEMSLDSANVSFAAMARRIDAQLEQENVRSAHVVGHAHGGGVALRLAASFPERVSKLTLIDAGAVPANRTKVFSSSVKLIPFLMRISGGRRFVESRFVNGIKSNLGRKEWFDKSAQRFYVSKVLDTPAAIRLASRLAHAEEPEPITDVLARVRVPVQVILGSVERSAAPNPNDIELLKSLPLGYSVSVLEGIGHFPHEEATNEVARLLGGTISGSIHMDSLVTLPGASTWPHPIANPTQTNSRANFLLSSTP